MSQVNNLRLNPIQHMRRCCFWPGQSCPLHLGVTIAIPTSEISSPTSPCHSSFSVMILKRWSSGNNFPGRVNCKQWLLTMVSGLPQKGSQKFGSEGFVSLDILMKDIAAFVSFFVFASFALHPNCWCPKRQPCLGQKNPPQPLFQVGCFYNFTNSGILNLWATFSTLRFNHVKKTLLQRTLAKTPVSFPGFHPRHPCHRNGTP